MSSIKRRPCEEDAGSSSPRPTVCDCRRRTRPSLAPWGARPWKASDWDGRPSSPSLAHKPRRPPSTSSRGRVPLARIVTGDATVFGSGYGHYGTDYIVRDGTRYIIEGGETRVVTRERSEPAVSLRFSPDVLRVGMNSPGTLVRVLEVFPDGYTQDVSNDPALEFTQPHDFARLRQDAFRPGTASNSPGETRLSARLGNLVTIPELLVQVGDYGTVGGRLEVYPPTLELWRPTKLAVSRPFRWSRALGRRRSP